MRLASLTLGLAGLGLGIFGRAAHADPATAPPAPPGAVALVDRVVATVDGTPLWRSALDELLVPLRRSDPKAAAAELERRGLARLIDAEVIRHAATALHVEVEDADVTRAWNAVMAQNHLTASEFVVALHDAGFTEAAYRDSLVDQLRQAKVVQLELASKISISDDDLAKAYAVLKAANPSLPPLAAIHDDVAATVRGDKLGAAQERWLDDHRRAAKIERRP